MALVEKYINPFTDFGFKKLFGTELNKDLLIDFLNEVVLPKERRIKDLTYRKNEHIGNTELDRKAIFDLYCIGTDGERFIVEMQKAKQNYFKDRSVFYSTFPIQEQAQRGDWDYQLSEVYTVGILDFVFSDDEAKDEKSKKSEQTKQNAVRHEVKLKNEYCQVFYDKLTFIYLEMPNFNKRENELETPYDKWLYVLKYLPTFSERPRKLQERIFQRLFEAAEIAKFSPEEKEQYEESLKSYRDLKNVIDTAFDEGENKGKIEGKIEGKLEEKINNIKKALVRKKLTIEEIAEDFDTTIDFVLQIKESHNLF